MKQPVIWINGFPGAGKFTVAKVLAEQDPSVLVIDNHKLIDPVAARFSRDHPDYQAERKKLRQQYLDEYVRGDSHADKVILFTDFQSTSGNGSDVAREYATAAKDGLRSFLPVYLTCDCKVNMRRALSGERSSGGTTKLTDEKVLGQILNHGYELHRFEGQAGLELDSTELSPEEAAREIRRFLRESPEGRMRSGSGDLTCGTAL